MRISKYAVVFWGTVCIAFSFLFGGNKSTIIEIINAIGSVFYGPVLVTFLLAMFSRKVTTRGINAGIVVAVLINLMFSKTMQQILGIDLGVHIFWIWLNFTGVLLTLGVAYLVSWLFPDKVARQPLPEVARPSWNDFRQKEVVILLVFFLVIIAFSAILPSLYG